MEFFFDDGDQHIGGDSAPDLRLDGVLAGAEKALDAQVLFDPFEEEFDLPAAAIKLGDTVSGVQRNACTGPPLPFGRTVEELPLTWPMLFTPNAALPCEVNMVALPTRSPRLVSM